MFRAAGGVTTGHKELMNNRFAALKALGEEMSSVEVCVIFFCTKRLSHWYRLRN
jgi:hypothetical protein